MSGETRPIKWIGRRSYRGRFVMGRKDILPICIKAGALDDNVPRRDLWISPHHAMYLEGVLIEAKDLVNGVSIVQAERVEKVEYFHIELDTHDVIIAEGALSESFIDDDSRGMFHNAHEYRALYPDAATTGAILRAAAGRRLRGRGGAAAHCVARRTVSRADRAASASCAATSISSAQNASPGGRRTRSPRSAGLSRHLCRGPMIGQTLANGIVETSNTPASAAAATVSRSRRPTGLAFAPHVVEVRRSLDGSALKLSAKAKLAVGSACAVILLRCSD